MKLAIQKAKQFGIGCVLVKNAGHLGGAGYHASMAAKQGCIGQVLVCPGVNILPKLRKKNTRRFILSIKLKNEKSEFYN